MKQSLHHRLPSNIVWLSIMMFLVAWKPPRSIYGFQLNTFGRHKRSVVAMSTSRDTMKKTDKGKLLVLGGTGFLGRTICKRAALEGYSVTSLSRRGLSSPEREPFGNTEYRKGDARKIDTISDILDEGGYVGKFSTHMTPRKPEL
eukprot:scaffold1869_cov122-Cylindrotheca_fusiformis.AAC.13